IVKMLHNVGANLSSPARLGRSRTPLQAAAESGSMEIVEYLLKQGVDPNEAPALNRGATALQLSAMKGFLGVAAILVEYGANVNAPPSLIDGRTCFEGAVEHGRIEMMMFLFQNKANLLSNNRLQYSRAVHFAKENHKWAAKALAEKLLETALKGEETPQTMNQV
ncbi:ankyrin, partial [Pyrenochaeta sp. DS3sAY3a]